MRHYSCDLCGKDLTGAAASRHVVRMELFAAAPPELSDADLDADAVADMAAMLEELEAGEDDAGGSESATGTRRMEYDLCPTCHRRFAADPLGQSRRAVGRFSKN